MWTFLISCPCLLSVWLRGVFVNGSCLSLPTCCSSEGCPQLASGEIDRTLRYFVLRCCAPAQQVGKSEGCSLSQSGRLQGRGSLEAPQTHRRNMHHFTCKWTQKIPLCLWKELCQKKGFLLAVNVWDFHQSQLFCFNFRFQGTNWMA